MRIFVTVGTFRFDELIKLVDNLASTSSHTFTCQLGCGEYKPKNCIWFEFSSNFEGFISDADLVITHAGAGTVYGLLEQHKNIIVIPNTFRVDQHQLELARYVNENNFALTCISLFELENALEQSSSFFDQNCLRYSKEPFNKFDDILELINN